MTTTFTETLHEGFTQVMDVTTMIVDERTGFQHVQIFDTVCNGRVMALDGIVQISTRDEAAYSEMLAHVPVMARLAAGLPVERVLIVGGGDGAVAEEVLKHEGVHGVELADIDGRVVELCREHFAEVNAGAFDDERLHLRIGDAVDYLRREAAPGSYDVIIVDRPDPVGPAEVLFADPFYALISSALSPEGVAVFQNGVPFFQPDELSRTMPQLKRAFRKTGLYLTVVPTYSGGFMTVSWASNRLAAGSTSLKDLRRVWSEAGLQTDYYSPQFHRAAFVLPPWIGRLAEGGPASVTARPKDRVRIV